jgi:hypothetical protein
LLNCKVEGTTVWEGKRGILRLFTHLMAYYYIQILTRSTF